MIHVRDATMLALTKLRTRKVRLSITIVISGLLFSGLAAASLVAHGIMHGVSSFGKEGLGSRYIVQAYPQNSYFFMQDPTLLDRAAAIQKDIVARKKVEAKRLGLSYEPASEQSPIQEYEVPGGKQRVLNSANSAAKQAIQEYLASHPSADQNTLAQEAKPYHPIDIYSSIVMAYDFGGQIQVLKDGQETFAAGLSGKGVGPPTGTDSFIQNWTSMSHQLLEPFILPGQNLAIGADGSIPIIVPHSAAEQILKLKGLPASAKASERLARTKEIRDKAPKTTFTVCYRNAASLELVNQAVAAKQDYEKNKNKKDYQKPDLIYGLPTEPCGSAPIIRDVRTKEEKTLAANQQTFNQLFGAQPPEQQTVTFRIVGIVPDPDYSLGAIGVGQIVRSLLTSSLGSGWYTPSEAVATRPLLASLFNPKNILGAPAGYYVEFSSASQARKFVDKENCPVDTSKLGPFDDYGKACQDAGKPFNIAPYGSNSLALESAKRNFGKFFGIAALVVSVIACIIMMGTVGRMIADSRRETAVFRAIGAKKLDIAQIYIVYVICLSLLIALFALMVGCILALVAHHRWSAEATVQAITAFNAQDLTKTFPLFWFYPLDMLMLVGLSVVAGLLSALLPLFRNLRRNPIRDMRDDT